MGTYARILSEPLKHPNERADERSAEPSHDRTIFRTDASPNDRTVERPARRMTRRYSFEFYEDQIRRLKQAKFEAEMRGETLYLSDIVREALDQYFAAKGE